MTLTILGADLTILEHLPRWLAAYVRLKLEGPRGNLWQPLMTHGLAQA